MCAIFNVSRGQFDAATQCVLLCYLGCDAKIACLIKGDFKYPCLMVFLCCLTGEVQTRKRQEEVCFIFFR